MIRVSAAVGETLQSQIQNAARDRTKKIIDEIDLENPEFNEAIAGLFCEYIQQNGVEDERVIAAHAATAMLFASYTWKMLQHQREVDELREMMA